MPDTAIIPWADNTFYGNLPSTFGFDIANGPGRRHGADWVRRPWADSWVISPGG